MDPSSPEFQPQSKQPTEPRPPAASEAQSRTTCRVCAEAFVSRNQLMRHLYKSHPKKPGKPKTSPKPSQTVQPPTPNPTSSNPAQSQRRVHPFSLLSQEQQIDFAGHVVLALFAVGMRQREEEEERQRQHGREQQNPNHGATPGSQESCLPPLTADSDTTPAPSARTDQTHHRKPQDDEESEDSDDEDGGVALFESSVSLGNSLLPFGLRDLEALGEDPDLD